jgi:hypothetical protein
VRAHGSSNPGTFGFVRRYGRSFWDADDLLRPSFQSGNLRRLGGSTGRGTRILRAFQVPRRLSLECAGCNSTCTFVSNLRLSMARVGFRWPEIMAIFMATIAALMIRWPRSPACKAWSNALGGR